MPTPATPTIAEETARIVSAVTSILTLIRRSQDEIALLVADSKTPLTAPKEDTEEDKNTPKPTTKNASTDHPPSLNLLHSTATLTRAHTNKLTLLLHQSPRPHTALRQVLAAILDPLLPALISTIHLTRLHHLGLAYSRAVADPFSDLLGGLHEILAPLAKDANAKMGENQIMQATGRVWSACDILIALKPRGLVGIVDEGIKAAEGTVGDAAKELEEWVAEGTTKDGDGDDGFGFSDDEDDGDDDDGEEDGPLPEAMALAARLTVKRLRTVVLLLSSFRRQRLAVGPPSPDPATVAPQDTTAETKAVTARLDSLVRIAERLPELADEVVAAWYDWESDKDGVEKAEEKLLKAAEEFVEVAKPGWKGEEDAAAGLVARVGAALRK